MRALAQDASVRFCPCLAKGGSDDDGIFLCDSVQSAYDAECGTVDDASGRLR